MGNDDDSELPRFGRTRVFSVMRPPSGDGWSTARDVLVLVVLVTAVIVNIQLLLLGDSRDWAVVLPSALWARSTFPTTRSSEIDDASMPLNMLIAMMTVPRQAPPSSYLQGSLESLHRELLHLPPGVQVSVLVNNLRPKQHKLFEDLHQSGRFENFAFRETIPRTAGNVTWQGTWGPVYPRTFQLNLDLLDFLSTVRWDCKASGLDFVLILEDDFVWCPFGLRHVVRSIRLAIQRGAQDFLTMRVAYGNNGLILRCRDLAQLLKLGETYKTMGPLDSIFGQVLSDAAITNTPASSVPSSWRGRAYLTYRYNLMEHIGHVSARLGGTYGQEDKPNSPEQNDVSSKSDEDPKSRNDTADAAAERDDFMLHNKADTSKRKNPNETTTMKDAIQTDSSAAQQNWMLPHRRYWSIEELKGTRGRLCYPQCFGLIQYVGLMPGENFADGCLASVDDLSPCRCLDSALWCRGLAFADVLNRAEYAIRVGLC